MASREKSRGSRVEGRGQNHLWQNYLGMFEEAIRLRGSGVTSPPIFALARLRRDESSFALRGSGVTAVAAVTGCWWRVLFVILIKNFEKKNRLFLFS